ncbi:unnamed protein product [Malus baccata var. baccata]
MVADAAKQPKLTERAPEDDADHLDKEFVLSVQKLQEVQDELDKVDDEENDKVLDIEQKYNEIRRPVYVKRNEIIKTIPDFWLTSFMSHPVLCDILSAEDQKIFKYLKSIDVVDFKDDKTLGYSVTFTTKITGTPVKWKEGMGLANGVTDVKNGKKRPHVDESFFSLFNETEHKDIDAIHDEVVEIIKNDLWPNPLKYFNNEADEEEVDEEDSEDDEMENGDEEDDEDDDDEEDS